MLESALRPERAQRLVLRATAAVSAASNDSLRADVSIRLAPRRQPRRSRSGILHPRTPPTAVLDLQMLFVADCAHGSGWKCDERLAFYSSNLVLEQYLNALALSTGRCTNVLMVFRRQVAFSGTLSNERVPYSQLVQEWNEGALI